MKIFPKLKSLDGQRGDILIEPGTYLNDFDNDADNIDYKADKENWFNDEVK